MSILSIRELLNGRKFLAVSPEATLEAASDLMLDGRVSAMPVVSDGTLVGIITERDILRHVSQRGGYATARVAEAMSRSVVSVETRESVMDAVVRMQTEGFRQLPVVDMGGRVVGVLTVDDIPPQFRSMRTTYVAWRGSMAAG